MNLDFNDSTEGLSQDRILNSLYNGYETLKNIENVSELLIEKITLLYEKKNFYSNCQVRQSHCSIQKSGFSKSAAFFEQENALNNLECDLKALINQQSQMNSFSKSASIQPVFYMHFCIYLLFLLNSINVKF